MQNSRLVDRTINASKEYAKAQEKENTEVNELDERMSNLTSKVYEIMGKNMFPKITLSEALSKKGTEFEETTEVIEEKKSMIVPKGFKITEGESIDTGIVVKDRAENEFVWVPVDDPNTMYGTDASGNKLAKLYEYTREDDGTTKVSNLNWTEISQNGKKVMIWDDKENGKREPDILSDESYDTTSQLATAGFITDLNEDGDVDREDFKIQLQKEFDDMIESVKRYKGFYIGRYETSDLQTSTPKVQKDKGPTINVSWYTSYKNSKEIAKEGLETEETPSVVSGLIWGCQWDAVMNWFLSSTDEATRTYVTDSTDMGWYGTTHTTGTDLEKDGKVANRVNNIYDMAGNIYEWTMEAEKSWLRVGRGGGYGTGLSQPASCRGKTQEPSNCDNKRGARAMMYILN